MTSTKKLSIALIISGALNFLFLGVIITAIFLRGGGDRHDRMAPRDIQTKRAIAGLSEEYQEQVADIWQKHLSENRGDFRQTIELRQKIKQLLMAEEIDEATIKEAIAEMHTMDNGLRTMQTEALIEIAKLLPKEERESYFARTQFGRPGDRGPRRRAQSPKADRF